MNMYNILDRLKELAAKDPHYADAARSTQAYGQPVLEGVSGETCTECGMYESHCECPEEKEVMETQDEDMEEGNEFSGALAKAKASGAKEFEVDGKKYPVKEDAELQGLLKHAGIGPMLGTSMSQQVDTVVESIKTTKNILNEGSYSAKSASAGRDIGKPGKNFEKIAKSAGERYGSKAAGERVAGAVLAKLRAKESVHEDDAMGRTGDEVSVGEGLEKYPYVKLDDQGRGAQLLKSMPEDDDTVISVVEYNRQKKTPPVSELMKKVSEARDEKTHKGGTVKKTEKGTEHRGKYGTDYQGDDSDEDDEDDIKTRRAQPKEKRGRGRPKKAEHEKSSAKLAQFAKGAKTPAAKKGTHTWGIKGGEKFEKTVRESADAVEQLRLQPQYKNSYVAWKQSCRQLAESMNLTAEFSGTAELAEARIMGQPVGIWDGSAGVVRLDERAVSKAQRAAAGIAYAAKKGDIPKSELRGASKEMASMPEKELKKFAKTREKGLPEKIKESQDLDKLPVDDKFRLKQRQQLATDHQELNRMERSAIEKAKKTSLPEKPVKEDDSEAEMTHRQLNSIEDAVEELRSIVDAGDDLPEWVQKKITLATDYIDTARDHLDSESAADDDEEEESKDQEESKDSSDTKESSGKGGLYGRGVYEDYDAQLAARLDETLSITTSQSTEGQDSITVTATEQDAHALAEILKMAGLGQYQAYQGQEASCGQEAVQEDLANAPDERVASTDELVNKISGGLNGQKLQYARGYAGDNDITSLGENLWREYSKK